MRILTDGLVKGRLTVAASLVALASSAAAVDPAAFGFDPGAEPGVNAVALQRALDAGGAVRVAKPGRYRLDRTVYVGDDTELAFAPGTVLVKATNYCHMLCNRDAGTGRTNANITIRNLGLADGGFNRLVDSNSPLKGLRGHASFWNVRNLTITGLTCLEFARTQYCLQVVGFDGLTVEDFVIRGQKDGIHLNAGRNFTIRRGRLRTLDDGIALNAGEWPHCTPEMGSVTDGVIEDVVDEAGGACGFVRVITGSWIDWYPGMPLQRSDIFRHNGRLYTVYPAPLSSKETASFHPPTHGKGVWKSPEGLNFLYLQPGDVMSADVTNVVIRNCTIYEPNRRVNCMWEISEWARVLHPKVPGERYPKIDIRLENVAKPVPGTIVHCSADATVALDGCRAAGGQLVDLCWARGQRTRHPQCAVTVDGGRPFAFTAADGALVPQAAAAPNPTRSRISRTLARMAKSTAERPETVRVLFYGQSIVQQNWGPLHVIPELQRWYPTVRFVVENRAIGGYESPALIKTAESDLYPFYPDLLFFHVYGPTDRYAKIVERVRERTTADVVLWTSHLNAQEGATPEKIAALLAQPDRRSLDIRATAERLGCMFVDLRSKWCRMLQRRGIVAQAMLADGIHMKRESLPVYAAMIAEDLLQDGPLGDNPAAGAVTRAPGTLSLEFTGNRVVAVADGRKGAAYDVYLDGKPVTAYPEMWTMTRSSRLPCPRAWNPMLDRIDIGPTPPVREKWTMTFLPGADANGTAIPFELSGSVTGKDGTGVSNRDFVSKSGRVSLKRDGWSTSWWWGYHKASPQAGATVTWESLPLVVTPYAPGERGETAVLVQNCANGRHRLELRPKTPGPLGIAAFEVHRPASLREPYAWRGLMLDEGRYFFGKAAVKETLDRMAACGLNVFHWHLTEDQGWRLEIRRFPELTRIGAVRPGSPRLHTEAESDGKPYGPHSYTAADVREIVAYAAKRNIRVVPEIELPGHVKALLAAHPEFSCTGKVTPADMVPQGVQKDVLCAGNDAAIRFLEQVFDEVCELFPGDVIHIGGDECPKDRWRKCPKCQARIRSLGLRDERDLQAWVTHHFANYLARKGRRAMGWDEILEGEGCPTNVIVQCWRPVTCAYFRLKEPTAITAARRGFDVVLSPLDRTYLSVPYGKDDPGEYRRPVGSYGSYLTEDTVRGFCPETGFPPELKGRILGAECCCWSEGTRTPESLRHKTWPRAEVFARALETFTKTKE